MLVVVVVTVIWMWTGVRFALQIEEKPWGLKTRRARAGGVSLKSCWRAGYGAGVLLRSWCVAKVDSVVVVEFLVGLCRRRRGG